jgi:hypothetical protein
MTLLSASAATIGETVGRDVIGYLQRTKSYRQPDDGEFRRLWAECDKLARADAVGAMVLKANLSVAAGALDDALYYVRNIKANRSGEYLPTLNTVLVNFGKFSESLPTYRDMMMEHVSANYLHLGVANGAYITYLEALDNARTKMQLDSIFPEAEESIRCVASILQSNEEDEGTIARAMDIAGEVLNDHRLLFHGLHHALRPVPHPFDGGPAYFGVEIGVSVDHDTALDLTCEYVERLSAANVTIPISMVLKFKSVAEPGNVE